MLAIYYHALVAKFASVVRKHGIELFPDVTLAKHASSDLKFVKFVVLRKYKNIPDRAVLLWGDLTFAWVISLGAGGDIKIARGPRYHDDPTAFGYIAPGTGTGDFAAFRGEARIVHDERGPYFVLSLAG